MSSFQGGYHSKTRSLVIMQNLSKIRSNSCIHRFILNILPPFVISNLKFYPPFYHHLKIKANPSHHSPNEQLSFSFDSTTRDFNSLFTNSNSFFIPFPNFSLIFFFFFFNQGEGSLLHNQELHIFFLLSLEFSFLFNFFCSSLSSFSLSKTQDINIQNTQTPLTISKCQLILLAIDENKSMSPPILSRFCT